MSRRGDCWDNAVAESFFATLKVELVHDTTGETRAAAHTVLFDYLELFYNGHRRHSALGYLSPRAFERRHEQEAVATYSNLGVYETGASPPIWARSPALTRAGFDALQEILLGGGFIAPRHRFEDLVDTEIARHIECSGETPR